MIPTSKFINDLKRAGGMTKVKLRRLKGLKWKYPLSLERQYAAAINRFMSKRWKEYAKIAVPMMVPRVDALEDLEPVPGTNGPALGAIVSVSKSLSEFNRREMNAFKKIAIGEAFAEDEPWLKNVLETWSSEQVTLITKATQDMLDTVARRIRDGVKVGKSAKEVAALINADLPGISYRRARIIARDQTAKLNSSLTQGRMTDAGMETYIWDTAQDERVRGDPSGLYPKALPSHFVMQGKICRWDDPTVWLENGEWVKRAGDAPYFHPGMAIMCRCVAVPNWNELEGVEGSDLPAVPEEVAPPTTTEPEPIAENVGIFASEKEFLKSLSAKFPESSKIPNRVKRDAFERIKRLDGESQLAYSNTFLSFVRELKSSSRSAFGSFFLEVKIKRAGATGGDIVHEVGHAIDRKIGRSKGAVYASALKSAKFGNRNLGEIVRDELIDPIVTAVKAERLDTIKGLVKSIPNESRAAIADSLKAEGSQRYDWIRAAMGKVNDIETHRKTMAILGTLENREMFEALANGKTNIVSDYVLNRIERYENPANLTTVDKFSKTLTDLVKETKKGGDEDSVFGSFSDMFEAGTGKENFFGNLGHGSRYWRVRDGEANKSAEAFAEILEMLSSPNDNGRELLEKYLPTSRDFVLDLIKEAR